jgi:hypothetical protein
MDGAEEREVKLAVAEGFVLPALTELAEVTTTDRGDERLRAVYWDTDDLALAHAGVGLRHRNGVWAYKGRSRRDGDAVVREEIEERAGGDTIPTDIGKRVQRWVDPAALHPVAELDTVRHQVDVVHGDSTVELGARPRRCRRRHRRGHELRGGRGGVRNSQSGPGESTRQAAAQRRRDGGHHAEVHARAARPGAPRARGVGVSEALR